MHPRRRLALLALAAVSTLTVAGLWLSGVLSTGTEPQSNRVVVYAGPGEQVLPAAPGPDAGFVFVASTADLQSKVDGSTRAIVLTPATIADVDPAWVRSVMATGVVLAGVRTSTAQLSQSLDVLKPVTFPGGQPAPPPALDDGTRFGDSPFFSVVYEVPATGNGMARGATMQPLESTDLFLAHLARYMSNAQAQMPR